MQTPTTAELLKYAISTQHPNITTCKEFAEKIAVHAQGKTPRKLIGERRPNESEATKKYRENIFVPITQEAITKVLNSLSKIRRSQDWIIQHEKDLPKQVKSDESLENYFDYNYPQFTSLTNWAFSELLHRSLIDANSLCAVVLKDLPESAGEYLKPQVELFSSEQIMNYDVGEWYVLKSADTIQERANNGVVYNREIYYVITKTTIARYNQTTNGNYTLQFEYNHNMGFTPVCKVGGIYFDRKNNDTVQVSRIASMIPFLDEAAREYSDLQAEIVQHIFSEKIVYTSNECPVCKANPLSLGKDENGNPKTCTKCNGAGRVSGASPYGVWEVTMGNFGENPVPTPAIAYVQKGTEIARLQNDRVNEHIYKSLSSVNMEFLAQSPLNQSGRAKEIDKDELDNFVNSVAEDIVFVMDFVYKCGNEYRYSRIVPDKEARQKMLPKIPVPERFGLLSSSVIMREIQSAKSARVNPVLVKNMEIDYAMKNFNANPEIAYELQSVFELDPFYGFTQQEKIAMVNSNGITETDYIISCNIAQFVQKAMKEFDDFNTRTFAQKRQIMENYAEEVKQANSVKEAIYSDTVNDIDNADDTQE